MKIFVVILNFNGKDFTLDCLTSLQYIKKPQGAEISLVVVDNASTDGSVEFLRERYKDLPAGKAGVKILKNKENFGFAEGNNVGIRYSLENGADFVFILNNDTLADENLIVQLIEIVKKTNAGIVGPKIYFAPGHEFHKARYKKNERGRVIWYAGGIMDWENILASHRGVDEVDHDQYNRVEETDFISGCAILVRKEVFEKIGFFDPKYFLYWEDNDFCQRARKAGFKLWYAPEAKLWHLNAGATGGSGSNLQEYFISRNRLLFGMRYASLRTKIALIRESLKILFFGRKWQKIGVRDFCLRKFNKGSWYS